MTRNSMDAIMAVVAKEPASRSSTEMARILLILTTEPREIFEEYHRILTKLLDSKNTCPAFQFYTLHGYKLRLFTL